jgi:5-formyltetrahydrofolate cyclo-ligase
MSAIANKSELRKMYLAKRLAISPDQHRLQSASLCQHLFAWIKLKKFDQVFLYKSFRNEPDLMPLATKLEAELPQMKLGLPLIGADQRDMMFCAWKTRDPLIKSRLGTEEPARSKPLLVTARTLILVPALAIARASGGRLGYGAGFYDLYLKDAPSYRMGVVFSTCVAETLPIEDHDSPLHGWCSEIGVSHVTDPDLSD